MGGASWTACGWRHPAHCSTSCTTATPYRMSARMLAKQHVAGALTPPTAGDTPQRGAAYSAHQAQRGRRMQQLMRCNAAQVHSHHAYMQTMRTTGCTVRQLLTHLQAPCMLASAHGHACDTPSSTRLSACVQLAGAQGLTHALHSHCGKGAHGHTCNPASPIHLRLCLPSSPRSDCLPLRMAPVGALRCRCRLALQVYCGALPRVRQLHGWHAHETLQALRRPPWRQTRRQAWRRARRWRAYSHGGRPLCKHIER